MPEQMLPRLRDPNRPLDARWNEFAPFWRHARTTGYGRALLLAARDLFNVDDINDSTYQRLSEEIAASNRSGWYEEVLKKRANIELSVLDVLEEFDPTPMAEIDRRFFAPVLRVDDFLTPCNRSDLARLEARAGSAIHSLDDLLRAIDAALERAVAAGAVGIKVATAYVRSLKFEQVVKADAERVFNQLSRYPIVQDAITQLPPVSWTEAKPLQDYLMHHVIRRAIEHYLPIQVHTGLQEGNGNFLTHANPLNLVNLLIQYGEVRFDLFHAGYPYSSEVAVLGKNFPNVYVDLCWVHVISPWVARRVLHEWIETVPSNKILAFGGDYIFVEGAYAHARMARDNVAAVLTEKVETGYLREAEAMELAHKLLRDNALQLFCLRG